MTKHSENLSAYLTVVLIVTLFFLLSLFHPCKINSDVAFQIKSLQQLVKGETRLLNTIVLPDPRDLSRNARAWIVLWPPGTTAFFFPLIMSGLPLGLAIRLTAYLMFLLGSLGWIKVADTIKADYPVKIILSLVLAIYFLALGGVNSLIADVLPFGIMPWLFLYTLHLSSVLESKRESYGYVISHSCLLGFLLGAIYWVKYSAFVASLGLLSYLVIYLLFLNRRYGLGKRLFLLAACLLFLSLPVFTLNLLNSHFGGINFYTSMDKGISCRLNDFTLYSKPFYVKLFYLLSSFLGAPGLALSQSWHWLMHIIFFSDWILPLFSNLSFYQRTIPFAISGIPGTLVCAWLFFYSRKLFSKTIFIFGCCISIIPFALLLCLTNRIKINWLIYDTYRYASMFFIFTEIILISSFYHFITRNKKTILRLFAFFVLFTFFIVPNTFLLANFIKNDILERVGRSYISTKNLIFQPGLSETNVKSVIDKIDSLIKSPNDVVAIAVIDGSATSFGPWLEIKQRSFPLNYYYVPLIHILGGEGINIFGSQPFMASQGLRIILVISKTLEEAHLSRLQQRFPQAKKWLRLESSADPDSLVSIWYTDLKVS